MLTELTDRGVLPDPLLRLGIRALDWKRIRQEARGGPDARRRRRVRWIRQIKGSPIAIDTRAANDQHYEVPAAFFENVLGKHLKYSSAYWPQGVRELDAAEAAMLELTCRRAGLEDGLQVLELGCGWGSLSLWMAEHFPGSQIVSVSNSRSQRDFIMKRAGRRGIGNLRVVTADMNTFTPHQRFDRVVSVEMFEHMRNWPRLLARIAGWLNPQGLFFMHVFTHRQHAYPFEVEGTDNWMGRYFFTGGMMPSDDLLFEFQDHMRIIEHWQVDGSHYQKTADAWLRNLDVRREELIPVLGAAYGTEQAEKWFQRWRIFFMACSELWGYDGGREWIVSHYLMQPQAAKNIDS